MAKRKKKKKEEKPVGEILKEQGVVAPEEVKSEIKEEFEEGPPEVNKLVMEVEKIGAVVNTLKELGSNREQRINELSENIGEIRSLLFQRDATIREMGSKIERLEEDVKGIKPKKIEKEMENREKEMEKLVARVEKTESIDEDLSKRIRKAEKILNNIKSMENLTEIVKDIEEKVSEIKNIESSTKREAAKAERFYLEMGKRMDEFEKVKEDVTRLDEMSKELMRSVDENKIQLDSRITKKELEEAINKVTKIPEAEKEEKIKELEDKKAEIETLLKRLEEQKKDNIISEGAYQEIYEKNKVILDEINQEILDVKTKEQPKSLQEWLDSVEEGTKKTNEKLDILEVKRKSLEDKVRDLYSKLNEINNTITSIKGSIERIEKKPVQKEELSPKAENLVNKKKEITGLLEQLEDEYRNGNISEKTYNEIKEKNFKKLEEIESQLSSEKEKKEPVEEKSEMKELEEKINSLQGEKKEELKSLLLLAKEKIARGYPLLSKKYIDQIKEKLEG